MGLIVPDLDRIALGPMLGDRALRCFPAMLSTDAEALAWARTGGPHGAVVVAGYQASPRGRSGLSWDESMHPERGLGFSVVLRPDLSDEREGWPYLPVLLGVRDGMQDGSQGGDLMLEWPDRVHRGDDVVATIGVGCEPERGRIRSAVATILVFDGGHPRGPRLAAILDAIDRRLAQDAATVIEDYRHVCATLGRRVTANVLPMGPASPAFTGDAVDLTDDGGLVIATDDGHRMVVVPQSLGMVTDPEAGPMGPPGIG